MNLRHLPYSVLLLFFLSGCTHITFDHKKSAESDFEKQTTLLQSQEDSEESNHRDGQ